MKAKPVKALGFQKSPVPVLNHASARTCDVFEACGAIQREVFANQEVGPAAFRRRTAGAGEFHQDMRCRMALQAQCCKLWELAGYAGAGNAIPQRLLRAFEVMIAKPVLGDGFRWRHLDGEPTPEGRLSKQQIAADVDTRLAEDMNDVVIVPISGGWRNAQSLMFGARKLTPEKTLRAAVIQRIGQALPPTIPGFRRYRPQGLLHGHQRALRMQQRKA